MSEWKCFMKVSGFPSVSCLWCTNANKRCQMFVCQPVWSLSPEKWAAHKHSKSGEDSLLLQQLLSLTLQILSLRADLSRRLRRLVADLAVVCRCAQTWAHMRRREQTCADVSRCAQICADVSRHVQMWEDVCRCKQMWADVCRHVSWCEQTWCEQMCADVRRLVQTCADVCCQCRLAGETYWVRTGTLSPALRTCWRPWTLQATWAGGGLVVEGPGRLWVRVVPTFEMRCSDWTL